MPKPIPDKRNGIVMTGLGQSGFSSSFMDGYLNKNQGSVTKEGGGGIELHRQSLSLWKFTHPPNQKEPLHSWHPIHSSVTALTEESVLMCLLKGLISC